MTPQSLKSLAQTQSGPVRDKLQNQINRRIPSTSIVKIKYKNSIGGLEERDSQR